jgi:NTE family protein
VVASCSVPGWYRPTVIGGRRYIDGGVSSGTNADLMLAADVGEVYILAPAASIDPGPPRLLAGRLERYVRGKMTGALLREVDLLDAHGIGVTVLTPGPEDLAAIGTNLMDRRRREAVFETALRTVAAELDARRPLRVPARTGWTMRPGRAGWTRRSGQAWWSGRSWRRGGSGAAGRRLA